MTTTATVAGTVADGHHTASSSTSLDAGERVPGGPRPRLPRAGLLVAPPARRRWPPPATASSPPTSAATAASSRPEAIEDYDIVHLTDDLLGLLDDLGEEQAVFVGHDWGSMVVWQPRAAATPSGSPASSA